MDPVTKLSDVIDASLQENSLDKLNEYLASLKNPKEFLNGKFVLVLLDILKKNAKHEEKTFHVYCVLTCLQHFVTTVSDPQKWEKVSEDISKLCELVFIISSSFIKEDTVIQGILNLISAITDSVGSVADNLVKFLLKTLLASSMCKTHTQYTRLLIMILIGSLLQKSSRGIRTEILPTTIDHLNDLSNFLSESDDYETQVSVVEILARSLIFVQNHHKSLFTRKKEIGEMFKKHQPFLNFDPDCRLFLNKVNESLGDQQKIFSVPCMVVSADEARLKKPNDPAYSDFWVDFNLGSKSVSFYYMLMSSESWELMTIPQDKVKSAVAKDSTCQSRSGEKFEAVKFELTIDSSDLSPNSELPQKVKIYPQKDKFIKIEPIIRKIFNEKYETELVYNETAEEKMLGNKSSEDTHKLNGTCEDKSFTAISNLSEFPEDEEEEDDQVPDNSNAQSSLESEERESEEEEESAEGSLYSRYIKKKMLEEDKNNIVTNNSREDEGDEVRNNVEKTTNNTGLDLPEHKKLAVREDINSNLPQSGFSENKSNKCIKLSSRGSNSSVKSLDELEKDEGAKNISSVAMLSVPKTHSCKKRENSSELNTNSKKKRLYCFEKSSAEDVVMSSQDQVLSVEIPSYKITKKETFIKPQPNVNRKNISYSYITNKEKDKSAICTEREEQKQFNFEEATETQKSPTDDHSSENGSESSPQIFKDALTKTKESSKVRTNKAKFFSKKTKKNVELHKTIKSLDQEYNFRRKSAISDLGSPERREHLKCNVKTYGRTKPKKLWKRLRIETSDSDSQYIPPSKLVKEDNEETNKLSPKKTRFADRLVKGKIDPIRDNVFTNEMELEAGNDFEEPAMQLREIVPESLMTQEKVSRKISVKVVQGKNTAGKKKATKQTTKQINEKRKKPEPKKPKQDILEKLSENLAGCLDVIHYEPPEGDSPRESEDLALDILNSNDDKQKTLFLHTGTTFKVNDMVRFGKLLMKEIQEKLLKAEKLAQKEREMNFATFDYKVQASCNELYGNGQKMESLTEKLEKLNTMLQATYKLHKEITAEIKSEAFKIEDAKNDLMKNINKIEKTESSTIFSIFQGFGGYLKKLVLSFTQGNTTRSAITN